MQHLSWDFKSQNTSSPVLQVPTSDPTQVTILPTGSKQEIRTRYKKSVSNSCLAVISRGKIAFTPIKCRRKTYSSPSEYQ